jgi:hypothetical protein
VVGLFEGEATVIPFVRVAGREAPSAADLGVAILEGVFPY